MNIAIKSETIAARKALAGRVSLVTGSTSGIGLGIARALAAAGSDSSSTASASPKSIADAQPRSPILSSGSIPLRRRHVEAGRPFAK